MTNPIQLKRSSTAGNTPSSLASGEVAINHPDRKLYVNDGSGAVKSIDLTSDSEKIATGKPIGDALTSAGRTASLPYMTLSGTVAAGFQYNMGASTGGNIASGLGFGGSFYAANWADQTISATHSGDTRATWGITRTSTGSGANGPSNADITMLLGMVKANYLTSAVSGEIDGLSISVKQGAKDDCGGILIDARKVHNLDANDTGGTVSLETTTSKLDNAGNLRQSIQAIVGFGEGAGGASSTTGYGFYSEAQVGSPYSAFHASQVSPGQWQNAFTFHSSRSPTTALYRIDGAGRSYASGGSALLPGMSFQADPDTGFVNLSANAIGVATGGSTRLIIDSVGQCYPGADNIYALGASSLRWSLVYSAGGFATTSDARLKFDVVPSPLGLDFVNALQPKAFKFADGGTKMVDTPVEEDAEEPVLDSDGQPVFDMVPQFEDDGRTPIWDKTGVTIINPDGAPLLDKDGNPITKRIQRTIAVARTQIVKRTVNRPQHVVAPGKRTHFGFIAQDVRECLVKAGEPDAAMWMLDKPDDPDSRQGLRYEHLIAPLVAAVQEMSARLAKLEKRDAPGPAA